MDSAAIHHVLCESTMQSPHNDRVNPVTALDAKSAPLMLPPLRPCGAGLQRAEQADPMATAQRLQHLFRRVPPDQQPNLLAQALYTYREVAI